MNQKGFENILTLNNINSMYNIIINCNIFLNSKRGQITLAKVQFTFL